MKKIFLPALLAAIMLLSLASCTGRNSPQDDKPDLLQFTPPDESEFFDVQDANLTYAEDIGCFTVDPDGTVYAVKYAERSPGEYTGVKAYAYNLNGELIAEYDIMNRPVWVNSICTDGKILYYTISGSPDYAEHPILYSYDTETGEQTRLTVLDRFPMIQGVRNIEYLNGSIYIIGNDPDYYNVQYDLYEGSGINFQYEGTILAAFNLANGMLETVHDQLTNSFSITPDGKIMIHAYDSDGGFYFAELDPVTKATGERFYIDTYLWCFAYDGAGVILDSFLYYPLVQRTSRAVIKTGVSVSDYGGIVYVNGVTFYLNGDFFSNKLERTRHFEYIKENQNIRMISSINIRGLFSSGYSINHNSLSREEFSLNVLANNRDYDICYLR